MGFAAFTFFVIFLLIASGGLLLFYREAMLQRISAVVTPRAKQGGLFGTLQDTFLRSAAWCEHFERILPRSQAEVSVVRATPDPRRLSQRFGGERFSMAPRCWFRSLCACWSLLTGCLAL